MLRYAFLCVLGLSALYVLVGMSAQAGGHMLAQAGHPGVASNIVWIAAIAAAFTVMALARFLMSGTRAILANWYWRNRSRMYAMALVGLLCGVFLVV